MQVDFEYLLVIIYLPKFILYIDQVNQSHPAYEI